MTPGTTYIALFGTASGVFALTCGLVDGVAAVAAVGAFCLGWTWAGVLFQAGHG